MSSKAEGSISIELYNPIYKAPLEEFILPKEQLTFTAHPKSALEKCEQEKERTPFVILLNQEVAGFFVLQGWEGVKEYCDHKKAILFRAFSIHSAYQGKGIASKTMELLPSLVKTHFPDKVEIILSVNPNNDRAQHLYRKAGFIDKGIRKESKVYGELQILHLDLSTQNTTYL